MRKVFKYGVIGFSGAKPGDAVRFVEAPMAGKPGAILAPRSTYEVNAVLIKVEGTLGFVEVKPQQQSVSASGEAASAGGVNIRLPITVGGSLKIS